VEFKKVSLLGVVLAAFCFTACAAEEGEEDTVEFGISDPVLNRCVLEWIGKYGAPLEQTDVEGIVHLECQDYGIQSLEGIEHFHSLLSLSLWENEITDITPLAKIPGLWHLELGNNQISDITPLAGMLNLRRLGLAQNNVRDLSPLAELIRIEYLGLDHNGLTDADVAPLCNLNRLKWLSVEHNNIGNPAATLGCLGGTDIYWEYQNEASARTADPLAPSHVDIARAAARLAEDVAAGRVAPGEVDETLFAGYLSLGGMPAPDICIRTGGDSRISNFLLWDLAYTELFFTDRFWPEFSTADLDTAFEWFHDRQRRFGRRE